jgi:hypothetical protein
VKTGVFNPTFAAMNEAAPASRDAGLGKAVAFLKECILTAPPVKAFWA